MQMKMAKLDITIELRLGHSSFKVAKQDVATKYPRENLFTGKKIA